MTLHNLYAVQAASAVSQAEETASIQMEELQDNFQDIAIQTQKLTLYSKNGVSYVTLDCLSNLITAYPYSSDYVMRKLASWLHDIATSLPKGSIFKLKCPSGAEEKIAMTLPTAVKLLARSNSRSFLRLHNQLLDVLIAQMTTSQTKE